MTFAALAHPIRRRMVSDLLLGERSISDLARPHEVSFACAARHVEVLAHAGIVRRRRSGRTHMCVFDGRPLAPAATWIEELAEGRTTGP